VLECDQILLRQVSVLLVVVLCLEIGENLLHVRAELRQLLAAILAVSVRVLEVSDLGA
jgi:hypothetical protein